MRCKRILATILILALIIACLPVKGSLAAGSEGSGGGGDADEETEPKKVICIDPGHQTRANTAQEPIGPGAKETKYKVTGGATGCVTHVPEYKLNLKVAKKLRKELIARGYEVIMTRTKNNVNISNSERAAIANKAKVDAFIRIHANSSGSSSSKGALTIAPKTNNPFLSKKIRKKSIKFSKKVLKAFCKATGAKNCGVMYANNMSGINWSEVPVTIIEMGFLSNPDEDRLLQSKEYQKKMVKGMADGIDSFLKS